MGIVNGTTNYILTRMTEAGASYGDALAEAQSLGTPNGIPPPTWRATTPRPRPPSWPASPSAPGWWPATCIGRASVGIAAADIAFAARLGYVVKLLAVAERTGDGRVAVRVHPAMVPAPIRWPRCATRSTPCSSRARRSAS